MRRFFKAIKLAFILVTVGALAVVLMLHARFTCFSGGRLIIEGNRLCAVAYDGYRFVGWESGETDASISIFSGNGIMSVPIFEIDGIGLPIISIVTENNEQITTKESYVNCLVTIVGTENGLADEPARIKLRGNSTLGLDKKPYKLKFNEKVDLFSEGKAKEWTLLANHMDYSLSRNYLAYSVAAVLDNLKYTTSVHFVDVYLNGRFLGVYTLCEQVETGKNRVDIPDGLEDTDTGYLIEMDARAPGEGELDRDYFVTEGGMPYAIKSPDTEDEAFTSAHVDYIKGYVTAALAALDSGDWSSVEEYIDVYSFADGYILDELFKPCDIGFSSFYMYKDAGGKLCRGPVWDYDLSSGNSHVPLSNARNEVYSGSANPWYARLLTYSQFRTILGTELSAKCEAIEAALDDCFTEIERIKPSLERNFEIWDVLGKFTMEWNGADACAIETLDAQIEYLEEWMEDSLEWLIDKYGMFSVSFRNLTTIDKDRPRRELIPLPDRKQGTKAVKNPPVT